MAHDTRKIHAACLPAHQGVSAILDKLVPIMDRVPGLEGVEMTFLFNSGMRAPLAEMMLGLRTEVEDGPGIYMTQWAEHLERTLPAAEVLHFQQAALRGVAATVAIERVAASGPAEYVQSTPLRVFFTREALFVAASDPTRLLVNIPDEMPQWHRELILSVLPRGARSNHDRMALIPILERSFEIWAQAYTHQVSRFQRNYKVDIRPPERSDLAAALEA